MLDILNTCQIQQHNLLVYLAIPPHVFGESAQALKLAKNELDRPVTGFTRVIIEKPFGRDTASCQELLDTLKSQQWDESDLFRIDHYLGKEIVQAIVALRQHNPWLKHLWNKDAIQSVHLVFKEPFGTEGRGGYFDPYGTLLASSRKKAPQSCLLVYLADSQFSVLPLPPGIIRDILQNHLLQVLTLIAMDLPEGSKWTADDVRDAKVQVLKNMSTIQLEDCLLGQYEGYRDDPTIENQETVTPTYACIRTWVNSETWHGVPFVMEAGKALNERLCEARLYFRGGEKGNNALVFRLQPSPSMFFTTNMKTPGFSDSPVSCHVGVDYTNADEDGNEIKLPEAYTKLVLDVLRGKQANFVRDDELLEAWKRFTPLLHQQESMGVRPAVYAKGTEGPEEREKFLQAMGVAATCLPLAACL
jgi:glucose-6-phosphate 1-dehydrogenase